VRIDTDLSTPAHDAVHTRHRSMVLARIGERAEGRIAFTNVGRQVLAG
jgi:hypothetical protein